MDTRTIARPAPLTLGDGRPATAGWTLDPTKRHINHGSFGAVPIVAQDHQQALRREMEAAPLTWFPALPAKVGAARVGIADFLGASVDQLAMVPNASAGASVVFSSLPVQRGLEILVTDQGYGAITMGAERLARRWGAPSGPPASRSPPTRRPPTTPSSPSSATRTRLIVVDQITSPTARLLPTRRIAAAAAPRGVRTLVDGAHAPGLFADAAARRRRRLVVRQPAQVALRPARRRPARHDRARPRRALAAHRLLGRERAVPRSASTPRARSTPRRYLAAGASIEFIEDEFGWPRRAGTHGASWPMPAPRSSPRPCAAIPATTDPSTPLPSPVPSMRLVRLPLGLGATREEADALRDGPARRDRCRDARSRASAASATSASPRTCTTRPPDFEAFVEPLPSPADPMRSARPRLSRNRPTRRHHPDPHLTGTTHPPRSTPTSTTQREAHRRSHRS